MPSNYLQLAELIPALTEDEYKGLEASIVADGCRDALVVWGDVLVDGHNRYRICTAHNVPFQTVEKDFADRDAVKLWMMRNQLSRRNLNDFQRIEIVRKCEDAVKAEAEQRMLAGKADPMPKSAQGSSRDVLAGMAGVGHSTYKQATTILDKATEAVVEAVRKEELSINAGYEVTKLPEAKQDEITERIKKGEPAKSVVKSVVSEARDSLKSSELGALASVSGKTYDKAVKIIEAAPDDVKDALRNGDMSINQAYRQVKEAERKAERQSAITEQLSQPKTSSHVDIFTTDKKYRVIYADPPWSYNDKQNTVYHGGAEKHYPTMPIEEICALPIPAEKDSILFLWTTSPMLEDAFKVINAWGFKYKSSFIWDKVSTAMGNYNSVRHEFLLISVRGSCVPDVPRRFDSVVSIPRTEHSRKPEEFRQIIDTLYPVGKRIEMFAREPHEGWDVWGNMA